MNCFNSELIHDIDILENETSPKEEHFSVGSEYKDEHWQNVHEELDQMDDYNQQVFWEIYDSAFKSQG